MEILTDAQLLGIGELRVCIIPDSQLPSKDGSPLVPYVDFDKKNQRELPCNAIVPERGSVSLASLELLPIPRVPTKGCLVQRQAGLCPRELGLTLEEINSDSV